MRHEYQIANATRRDSSLAVDFATIGPLTISP
jgi:hypothetical protein